MKFALSIVALFVAVAATPAFAGDGHVSHTDLEALGLGSLEVMSDDAGHQIRGQSGNAMAMGLSIVAGALFDPATKSFVSGASADSAMSSAENAGLQVFTVAGQDHQSNLALALNVVTNTSNFAGILIGGAGGNSFAFSQ